MRLFDEFLDILESLECVLQSIFEMKIEIPSGSIWKMVLKLGTNSFTADNKTHEFYGSHPKGALVRIQP